MRWNCPHCKTAIVVSASELRTQWTFTECFQCSGISLVRRNDINIIRVDRKPSGETILKSRSPFEQLNQTVFNAHAAMQVNQARASTTTTPKTIQRPDGHVDVVFQTKGKEVARELGTLSSASENLLSQRAINTLEKRIPKNPSITLPQPILIPSTTSAVQDLAHELEQISKIDREPTRLFSYALIFLGTMTLVSGTYLFIQGKALWNHTRVDTGKTLETTTQKNDYPKNPLTEARSVDQIKKGAMAPMRSLKIRPTSNAIIPVQALEVQAVSRDIALLSGPGFHFSTVLKADVREKYSVNEIQEQWYKVWVHNKAQFAWVHHDWVKLMPKPTPTAQATEEDQFFEDTAE